MVELVRQAFVINMDKDLERRTVILKQFSELPNLVPNVVAGLSGSLLPTAACASLAQDLGWAAFKGTIGCFLSHVKAWEAVAQMDEPLAVVLEDDADIRGLSLLAGLDVPGDIDIVFLNDRMSPCLDPLSSIELLPIWHSLKKLDALKGGPGGDGYLLSRAGARKLLEACRIDLFYGHVDGRLLRYATQEEDLAQLPAHSWVESVVRNHHHPILLPQLGLLNGRCVSMPLVRHRGVLSTREAEDAEQRLFPVLKSDNRDILEHDLGLNEVTLRDSAIPIRYYNRTSNAGDLINPYLFQAIARQRPVYCDGDREDHVLGAGSIFFMASPSSYIWGSGILSPNLDCSQIDQSRITAVRGKKTLQLLRSKYGFSSEIPLGDPGIFVDEIPEIIEHLKAPRIKRRVGVVPHYALSRHQYFLDLVEGGGCEIISPRMHPLAFVAEIISSEIIVSQSLHGLIFAQLFGKPYVWLSHSEDIDWAFKFEDWFSNIDDPPKLPELFGTELKALIAAARTSHILLDRKALRDALPDLEMVGRSAGVGFRETRERSPMFIFVGVIGDTTPTSGFDATFVCNERNESELQIALQNYGTQFDEPFAFFLIFNDRSFQSTNIGALRDCDELLTVFPDVHYFELRPRTQSPVGLVPTINNISERHWLVEDKSLDELNWTATLLIRHPSNFSFSAPSKVVYAL